MRLVQERADVLAEGGLDFDVESGLRGDVDLFTGGVVADFRLAVQFHCAGSVRDLHAFGLVGSKMEFAGLRAGVGYSCVVHGSILYDTCMQSRKKRAPSYQVE